MSNWFEIYQENLSTVFTSISSQFEIWISKPTSNESKKPILETIQIDWNEAEKLLKTLQIQIATGVADKNYSQIVKTFKKSYDDFRRKYNKEKDKYQTEINLKLIQHETNSSSFDNTVNDAIAYKSFGKLERAKRTAIEMENVGGEIMIDMNKQNEGMKSIKSKVGTMSEQWDTSSSLMSDMERQNKKNKSIWIIFSGMLIVMFIGIVIFRLWMKSSSSGNVSVNSHNNTNTNNI